MGHDVVIVGGGPAGYATAFRAAARGLDVGLVERDQVGGTCLHRGCIPSKANLHVAEVVDRLHEAERFGIRASTSRPDGAQLANFRTEVIERMHRGLDALVGKRTTRYGGTGVVQEADGRLGVEVRADEGDPQRLEAEHVVVATGSRPATLPGVDVDGAVVQTSDQALWFTEPPARAVIVGAGAIGVEFASMWSPLGAEVTLLEGAERILPTEDEHVSSRLHAAFTARGIDVRTGTSLDGVRRHGATATVSFVRGDERGEIEVDRVLIAIGRSPATEGTGLEELGVLDAAGYVVTDAWGATEVPGLWAAGDVRPTLALAHAGFAEGAVVADRIAGLGDVAPVDHTQVPRVTYSIPEVASVGLTVRQARERHGDAVVTRTVSLDHNAKGLMAGGGGSVLVVQAPGPAPVGAPGHAGGPVLGVHVVGPHATELIAEATLATTWGAVPEELASISHAHPTLYEALGEAFASAAGLPVHGT